MPRGNTLLEVLVALAIAGLLAAFALPALAGLRDRLQVNEAVMRLRTLYGRARLVATVEQRIVLATVRPDSLLLRVVDRSDTVTAWATAGPLSEGVRLDGPVRPMPFSPSGLAFGAGNATYTLTRGSAVKRVVVSRYGRLRVGTP